MSFIEKSYPGNGSWHPNGAGQRIEGTCLHNGSIYFTTSAKNHVDYAAVAKLIPTSGFEEYGRVWRMSVPGQVSSGKFAWRPGTTTLSFKVDSTGIIVTQDGEPLASKVFTTPFDLLPAGPLTVTTCSGIFGECASGVKIHVDLKTDDELSESSQPSYYGINPDQHAIPLIKTTDDRDLAVPPMVDIFAHGDGGFPCWRVPAVVLATSTGRLFAFAEARNYSGDGCEPAGLKPNASHPNEGPRSLALKTSTDSGLSVSNFALVLQFWPAPGNTLRKPCLPAAFPRSHHDSDLACANFATDSGAPLASSIGTGSILQLCTMSTQTMSSSTTRPRTGVEEPATPSSVAATQSSCSAPAMASVAHQPRLRCTGQAAHQHPTHAAECAWGLALGLGCS